MIKEIKAAIESKNIDKLLTYTKDIPEEEIENAINLYEKFYEEEMGRSMFIYNFIQSIREYRENQFTGEEGIKIIEK
ncbi:hypothetical protein EHP00_730 [Ecytonucleospora hepatopenaei]|uniref:Uncharacterized protein n=1 Tax=Ecytonucleospora hepatopenaei TaxID=646526 RepID=A0A1W0E7X2_9MICR|nr:hypothetical protein EHP00_730 [Ecytonucleospora hepatopenaei]